MRDEKDDFRLMVRSTVGDVFINIEENKGANTEAQSWKGALESLSSSEWSLESPCFPKNM
jgi:predicted negative regulator of RcsB-dependent stress response